ncbi:MAG: Mrp/NBP35 family ATP-binding protein [Verrucomicrobiae bacterium]|nr:Mrp/NBP35 family ATP-binding protein [Verrucomicrobiae bacterium]
MSSVTEEQIREALKQVKYPGFSRDIISFGILKGVALEQDPKGILLAVTTQDPKIVETIRTESVIALAGLLPGHRFEVQVQMVTPAQTMQAGTQSIPGVGHIIAVASGKGGVGKSTVAANLACALKRGGMSVGLLDCDIYGPSMGLMFGTSEQPYADEENRIEPVTAHGIRLMSMGFLMAEDAPAILRGPMVTRYTQQLLMMTRWGSLDVLLLDLPPGTGDIHLTIVQTVALSGAVIVTTPQDIALLDAKKGVTMFQKTNVKILGLVENMSYFTCPQCGHREEIFSHGGARKEAARLGVTLLGEIPLDLKIRTGGDSGVPIVMGEPEGPHARAFQALAEAVRKQI